MCNFITYFKFFLFIFSSFASFIPFIPSFLFFYFIFFSRIFCSVLHSRFSSIFPLFSVFHQFESSRSNVIATVKMNFFSLLFFFWFALVLGVCYITFFFFFILFVRRCFCWCSLVLLFVWSQLQNKLNSEERGKVYNRWNVIRNDRLEWINYECDFCVVCC